VLTTTPARRRRCLADGYMLKQCKAIENLGRAEENTDRAADGIDFVLSLDATQRRQSNNSATNRFNYCCPNGDAFANATALCRVPGLEAAACR
jgi:long-subunit fatty acid transport protein